MEGAAGAAAQAAAPAAAAQRRHGVAGPAAQELRPAGRVAAGAVAARRGAAAAHQKSADGDGRERGGVRVRRPRPPAAGHAAAAEFPLRRHAHTPGHRLIETRARARMPGRHASCNDFAICLL